MAEPKKRKPGRPPLGSAPKDRDADRHKSPRESFHLPGELKVVLEQYVATVSPPTTKSGVIVTALERYFAALSLWPPKPPKS